MTIDEAIAEIEQSGLYGNQMHQETLVLALDALRTQQQRENPQPLTVDTLYFMDGQPVWWWNKSHAPVCTLCVKNKADAHNPFFVCFDDPFADDDCTGLVKYQKLIKWGWRPYQYPPKEGQR